MGKQIVRQKWRWRGHTLRKDSTSITRQEEQLEEGRRERNEGTGIVVDGYKWNGPKSSALAISA